MSISDRLDRVGHVLAQHRLGLPHGGTASGALVLCGCGTVINGSSRDDAISRALRHIAAVLDLEGLLAPDMREEWGEGPLEDGEPAHWPVPVDGCVACDSARPTYRRLVTDWEES